jgi:acyl-CoA synthetase (AMP-forming)/AMP-acid ligase II
MNIARYLEPSAAFFPDRPAVRAEDREISYSGLLTGDGLALLVNPTPRFMFTNAAKLGALFAFEWNSKKKG